MSGDKLALKRARSAWQVMLRRCYEKTHADYARYGGRGIKVCPQWRENFGQFLADLGLPPTPRHWLGRIDVTASYTPENVTWTTHAEQMRRRAFCRHVRVNGQTMTAAEAGRVPGQPTRNTVLRRRANGFSLERPKLPRLDPRTWWITWQGETLPLVQWARRFGLPYGTLRGRIERGMPLKLAMTSSRYWQPLATRLINPPPQENHL